MNLKVLEILEKIQETLDKTEELGVGKEQYGILLGQLYDGLVGKYRPLVSAIPNVAEKVSKDIAPVIVSLQKIWNDIKENPDYQKELDRNVKTRVGERMKTLKIYQKAGFKRNEAMALLLLDCANAKVVASTCAYKIIGETRSK